MGFLLTTNSLPNINWSGIIQTVITTAFEYKKKFVWLITGNFLHYTVYIFEYFSKWIDCLLINVVSNNRTPIHTPY